MNPHPLHADLLLSLVPDDTRAGRIGSHLSPAVDVLEIAPGLWRWTAYHEEWKEDVGCTFVETDDGVVLIDPLVPARTRRRSGRRSTAT